MRSRLSAPAALLALLALLAVAFSASAGAGTAPARDTAREDVGLGLSHDLAGPMTKEFEARREAGLEAKLRGHARGKVARLGRNKYVELVREETDPVFVVIAEFGNTRHPSFCDNVANPAPPQPCAFPSDGTPQRYDGPLHNEIDRPDRRIDNSTLWQSDYNPAHYQDMYFDRMTEYFERQSSNRYSIMAPNDAVHGWVKVPFNEARYGRDFCGGIVCNNTWFLIRDAMSIWVQGQLDAGQTIPQIAAYLKQFDVWDRYDLNGNGNFDEPDGFIDHFQIVHAGGDQAAADPHQGTDAIWSHRWYASVQAGGPGGLTGVNAGSGGPSGQIPGTNPPQFAATLPNNPTGVWVGDYTIQPENGGLGVFAHEYAHDLGLPDLYDTSGNTGGAENSTGFWTLMSSGANIGDGGRFGIGDAPTDLGAWEKFQLGWLGCDTCAGGKFYGVAEFEERKKFRLGPNDAASKLGLQAAFAMLPDKRKDTVIGPPKTGSFVYWSSMGDEINTSMTKTYTVPAGATLTADVLYDIEEHFDYAFVEQSTNGGTTWQPVMTNLSDPAANDQSGFNASGTGITGSSAGAYRALTATLPGSGTSLIRFRYQTDPAVTGQGILIDNIAITGSPVDGAEDANSGWTFNGFKRTTGTEISFHLNAYVMENRQYDGYDRSLRTAYNFGFLGTDRPDWVEHFPYQDGLLISYWDETFTDNSVGDHPGGGLILPVDAHPQLEHYYNGQLMRARISSYDSTFGLERTDRITINLGGVPTRIRSKPAVRLFDDLRSYWIGDDGHTPAFHGRFQPGWQSVKVAGTGTRIRVNDQDYGGRVLEVEVNPRGGGHH
jgi:immune inhibitor A